MVETRSQSKANTDTTATEVDRTQPERRERSRGGDRPALATATEGALALPISSTTQPAGTEPCDQAQPSLANRPSVRSNSVLDANAKAPSRSAHTSVHSIQSCSERTHSSRSSATVRAQKLAIEADAMRRRVERKRQQVEHERELERQQVEHERELARQQAERERELARLEAEAEETELQARLAALEASDKSSKSHCSRLSNCHSAKRTATWVLEQNMTTVTNANMPGEAPTVTLGNPQRQHSQPAAPTNMVSFYVPNVNHPAPSSVTRAAGNNYHNDASQQLNTSERPISDPVTQLTQAINSLSNRPKRPELVTFSGEVSQWMAFKSSYERTKSNFSPSDNLDRLNNAVRGAAYQTVASLLWTSGEPDDIVSALEQTYARPELLVAREVAELRNSPKLSSPEELNRLAVKLRNFVTTLKLLNQSEYLWSPELFRCILMKLSEHTRARFTDFASVYAPDQPNVTKLDLLSRFLLVEADKQLKYNFVADSTVKAQNTTHPTRFQLKKETIHATVSNDKVPERCTYCKQGPHNIKTCKAFLALSIDDRWRWVRETKICYRCLKSSPHTWNFCRAKRCGVDGCPRRHNALLHGTMTANSKPSVASSSQCNNTQTLFAEPPTLVNLDNSTNEFEPSVKIGNTSDTLIDVIGASRSTDRPRGLLKVVPIVLEGPDGEFHTTALFYEGSTATLIDGEVATRIGAKPTCQERLRIEGVSGMTKEVEMLYMKSLPYLLFGGMAGCAGIMMLLTPETLHMKLPDTIEQAEQMSRRTRQATVYNVG